MRTLQEKYNAITEGNFSKEQFRRDAQMQLPNLVSKFNSFEDTVNILKNKGMLAEAKAQEPKYSTAKPEDTIAPDVLDTGIKFELDKKYGTLEVTDEQYAKCREMAIKNLANDVLYYVKQDSIQLETPGEKMEKVKLNEEIQNIENDEQTKKRIAGLTNQLLQDADPRDEYVKAYAVSVKRDLESGDASRMSQYKNILSLDDLKDDMEHYITHDVDQMEEESVEENALGMTDSRLTSKQHSDLDNAVRGDSAYSFGNDPYADDQLRYKYAKKMGFLEEADVDVSKDIPDIIAVDVPLFIRLLEFAREDAGDDMDLHEVAERAIEAVKMRGVLSMDDYETLVPPKEELDEVRLVPKDQIEAIATKLAAQIFSKKQDIRPAIDIFKKAVEDSYRALDPNVEIKEEEGYSKYLKDDPEFPGGKTPGLTPAVLDKILMKIVQDIDETKQLGEGVIEEELCPKGKAYIKKRQAAGEKSSAYLSGRAVKVCKGQMKG